MWISGFAIVLVACGSHATESASNSAAGSGAPAGPGVVDQATLDACTIAHRCMFAHPGLGRQDRSTSIDLASCTRTLTSSSGPYEMQPEPPPLPGVKQTDAHQSQSQSPSSSSKLTGDECARLRTLVLMLTAEDSATPEPAQVDTEACVLELTCGGEVKPRFTVQRQTTDGTGRVPQVIRAVYGTR